MSTVGFIIPALNEARHIERVLGRIPRSELERAGYRVRVMVVDGQSTDRTLEIAARSGAEVLCQSGRGKGQAVREAFQNIQADYVFIMDGDDTYPGEMIPRMLEPLTDGVDVVLGTRVWPARANGDWFQRAGNRFLTGSANVLFGTDIGDLCTGMWGFKGHVPKELELEANGFDIEAEMFARCARSGYRIDEVPVPYRPRHGGSKLSPVRDGARIFARLLREAFGLRKGRRSATK